MILSRLAQFLNMKNDGLITTMAHLFSKIGKKVLKENWTFLNLYSKQP